jgi:hypothetical protein
VPITNAAIFCNNKATIDIDYNHNIGDRSPNINIAYHFVHENIESGRITLLQVELAENLGNICTTALSEVTLQRLCWIMEDIFLRCYSLRILILHFIMSSSYKQRTFLIQGEYCVSVYVFRLY